MLSRNKDLFYQVLFSCGLLWSFGGCGVETGNPDKTTTGGKDHDEHVETFMAQYAQINAATAGSDSSASMSDDSEPALAARSLSLHASSFSYSSFVGVRLSNRMLATPGCSLSADKNSATVTYDLSANISFELGVDTHSIVHSGLITLAYSGLEGKAFCLGKLLVIPYLSLDGGVANVTLQRTTTYNVTQTQSGMLSKKVEATIEGSRNYQWEKISVDVDGYRDSLAVTYDLSIGYQRTLDGKVLQINRQLTSLEPIVSERLFSLKENRLGKTVIGQWQQSTLKSGKTQFTNDQGGKIVATYKDLLYNHENGCKMLSGSVLVEVYKEAEDIAPHLTYMVTVADGSLIFTFDDGTIVNRDQNDCRGF